MTAILMQTVLKDGSSEWGISTSDINPTPDNYYGCIDKDTAIRLKALLMSCNAS